MHDLNQGKSGSWTFHKMIDGAHGIDRTVRAGHPLLTLLMGFCRVVVFIQCKFHRTTSISV